MKLFVFVGTVFLSAWNLCPGVEYEFTLIETEPRVADALQTHLRTSPEIAVKAVAKLDDLVKKGTVTKLGEVRIETKPGQRSKGDEGGEPIPLSEKWQPIEGLNIELDPTVARDKSKVDTALAIGYYARGKGEKEGKIAEMKLAIMRIFVPGLPSLVYRSDRDGMARMLVGTVTVEGAPKPKAAQPKGTAMFELTAQLFEFGSEGDRNGFFEQNRDSAEVVGKLQKVAKIKYQATCASSPGQRWKLGDLGDLKEDGDEWIKDGTSLMAGQDYTKGGVEAEVKGTFSYKAPKSVIAKCEFENVQSEKAAMFKCEGSELCVLVLQSSVIGNIEPGAESRDEDPF